MTKPRRATKPKQAVRARPQEPWEVRALELERRAYMQDIQIAELRGRLEAMADHQRRERAAFEAELSRVVELLRGPIPGAGLATLAEQIAPPPTAPPGGWLTRYNEIHGAGISQEEMIERKKRRNGNEPVEAPVLEG